MNTRSFGLRDLPLLPRYRDRGLFLDSTRVLIHGSVMVPMGALISFIGPSLRIYTYLCEPDSKHGKPLIGQVACTVGDTYARLLFLAPEDAVEQPAINDLAEYIVAQMGALGMFHILADVDESNQVYHLLRRSGFAIYARQRIWRLDGGPAGDPDTAPWRAGRPRDSIGIRSLYCNVVPGLVQQVEPLPKKNLKGVVYYQNGELLAFVDLKYGRHGIWVQPFVHPDAQGFDRHLVHLLQNLPDRHERPLFICVRSYQSWLEVAVEAMGAQPGPQQAVMVRHLAVTRRLNQVYSLPSLNGKRPEPTAPALHIENTLVPESSEVDQHARINMQHIRKRNP